MSDTPIVVEVNCTTGEVVERLMTAEEIAQSELDAANAATRRAKEEQAKEVIAALKASARAKLVAGTPLTEEEAATLVI